MPVGRAVGRLFGRARRGELEEAHVRALQPGTRRLRAGGRARFTVFTKVDAKSEKAIKDTLSSFAEEDSGFHRMFFLNVFRELSPAHREALRRMNFRDYVHLADYLSDPAHREALKQVLGHRKVVEGTKIAADRFFAKNVASVLFKAAEGRAGLFNFGRGRARDDIATGILAAMQNLGLRGDAAPPRPPRPTPTPVTPTPVGGSGGSGFGSYEEAESSGMVAPTPVEPVSSGMAEPSPVPAPDTRLTSLVAEHMQPRRVRVFDLAKAGIVHHMPSRPFYNNADTRSHEFAVHSLMDHASRFIGHMLAHGLQDDDVERLSNLAANSRNLHDFQKKMKRAVEQSERGAGAKRVLNHFTIASNARLVNRAGNTVRDLPLDAHIRWRYKRGDRTFKMSEEQHSAAAFYLLARLAKLGQEHVPGHDASQHLALFANEVHTGIDRTLDTYRNLVTRPRRLSPRDAAMLLAAVALHGDAQHAQASAAPSA